jgi:hypothetical protein
VTGTKQQIDDYEIQIEAALRIQDDILALREKEKAEATEKDKPAEELSYRKYAKKYLKIRDKNKNVIPFEFNKAQEIVEKVRVWMKKRGYLERYLNLKARQKGLSTYWEGDIFYKTSTEINSKAAIVGHEMRSSNNLFDITKRFYNNLPEPMKPQTQHTSEKLLKFRKLDSEIKVMTAGLKGTNVGVSDTINYLHCTEVSRWNKQKETMSALFQTVPDVPESLIVIETTAHGIGDEYYNMWQSVYTDPARETIIPNIAWKSPSSAFVIIFTSWLLDDEYTKKFSTPEDKREFRYTLTDKEKILMKRGATLEHLLWRRFNIKDKQSGDEKLFAQEYPSTPEEAFLVSGRPVFDMDIVHKNYQLSEDAEYTQGDLVPVYEMSAAYERQVNSGRAGYYDLLPWLRGVRFQQNPGGFIKIFDDVVISNNEYNRFCGGWDIAEGLEQGDYTHGCYYDRKPRPDGRLKLVLSWHGHIDPDLVPEEQHKLHILLKKKAYVCTERNKDGLAVVTGAYKLRVPQYYQEEFGKGYIEGTEKLGFKTQVDTKPLIINDLRGMIRDESLIDPEKEFWSECMTFVKNRKGQMQAQGKDTDPGTKCFDDRIIGRALAIRCHLWMGSYSERRQKSKLSNMQEASYKQKSMKKKSLTEF